MMLNDKKIKISTGQSRKSTFWKEQELWWSEFVLRLAKPERTQETLAEYKAMRLADQDKLKDVGGFVGGTLEHGRRRNDCAGDRYLVTLDADNIPAGGTQAIINAVDALGCAYLLYSTRKHEAAAPRLRIVFPLNQPAAPDEYEPIARKMASFIGMQIFDPTTFQPVRMMYWSSCSRDSEYVFLYGDKPFLSKDGILEMYQDWKDVSFWPEVPGAAKLRNRSAKKQGNPLEKTGIVGAFCKIFNIEHAIAEFLSDVYISCGDGRYTYAQGSTVGGAVLYEDGNFLYSHHATDPAGGCLCNAFDLVRLHLFHEKDEEAKPDTPVTQLPSFQAMCEFAASRKDVARLLNEERYQKAQEAFIAFPEASEDDNIWMERLKCSTKTGLPLKTIDNVLTILQHDPRLKEAIYHDEFANRPVVCRIMPWETPNKTFKMRPWADEDDAGLRHYIETVYAINGKERIYDAFSVYATSHRKHKIREYLNGLVWDGVKRLDTLLIDYFGAAETPYTKAVIRKTLCAAVARAMAPGTKFDCMLILVGSQGIGKSTFFRILGKDWYSDSLATFEGKDAAELIQGYWVIEAGELTGMNKTEMNTVKQFLSKVEDVYRMPYGRRTGNFPRSCVIVGTTNDKEFLKDRTGNRRFWPVDLGYRPPTKCVFTQLAEEIDQIWAEAVVGWQCGEKLYLEGEVEKEAQKQQEEHKESNPKEGIILEFLKRKIPFDWAQRDLSQRRAFWGMTKTDTENLVERDRFCAAEIWCECFLGDLKLMRKSDTMEINSILASIPGWERTAGPIRMGMYYGRQRGYVKASTFSLSPRQQSG